MHSEAQQDIDRYLKGAMSPNEREAFEAKIAQDSDLSEAFKLAKLFQQSIVDGSRALQKKQIVRQLRWQRQRAYWYGAGTLLLLGGLAVSIYYVNQPPQPSPAPSQPPAIENIKPAAPKLMVVDTPTVDTKPVPAATPQPVANIMPYYKRPDITGLLSISNGALAQLFAESKRAFEAGQCDKVQPILKQLLTNSDFPYKDVGMLMQGCCYFEQRQWKNALKVFNQILVSDTEDLDVREHAEWYHLLIQYRQNPKNANNLKAIRAIKNNAQHLHQKEAEALVTSWLNE